MIAPNTKVNDVIIQTYDNVGNQLLSRGSVVWFPYDATRVSLSMTAQGILLISYSNLAAGKKYAQYINLDLTDYAPSFSINYHQTSITNDHTWIRELSPGLFLTTYLDSTTSKIIGLKWYNNSHPLGNEYYN